MAEVLIHNDAHQIFSRWEQFGPTAEEKDAFMDDAIAQLNDSDKANIYQSNISQIAGAAATIDKVFSDTERSFNWLARVVYSNPFPELTAYHNEWNGFKDRWRSSLHKSVEVAADNIDFLKRFEEVYLDKVERIQTDEDRNAAIKALQDFTDETHDGSVEMSRGFLSLKRDIAAFVDRFDEWAVGKGVAVEAQARQLRGDIDGLYRAIDELDGKIRDAKKALAIAGSFIFFIGLGVSGGVLASFQSQRSDKANQLENKKRELNAVKEGQDILGRFKSDFDGMKPDIALLCEKLVLFAETWASVRSQAVQFREILLGGMGAVRNVRFKKEVRLARAVCLPLIEGLKRYKAEIEDPRHWV